MLLYKPLTDFEIEALHYDLNLADGHAYQNSSFHYLDIVEGLETLWKECEVTRIPDIEHRFRHAFAELANSRGMAGLPFFKICPTASNSIDIIGAVLSEKKLKVRLIEPTFDNLALILRRRHVDVEPLNEDELIRAEEGGCIPQLLDANPCGALFLVQPNNPTGRILSSKSIELIASYCARHDIVLILDNSFRFFNRNPFDDYSILIESGCSFIAFEDTGKVWPTHDLKASLLFCSPNLQEIVSCVYNELFLCSSRFTLSLIEKYLLKTAEMGLSRTIWPQLDERRSLLREAIDGLLLTVDTSSQKSQISVEWIDCARTGLCDIALKELLSDSGVLILPGRQFFWASSADPAHQFNVRMSLMKPMDNFKRSVEIVRSATAHIV